MVVYVIPDLRPYATNKLDNRSKPCVFLEYSLTQSAYSCLDPSISKIYVSMHVRFVESVFPFTHISVHSSHPQSNSLTTLNLILVLGTITPSAICSGSSTTILQWSLTHTSPDWHIYSTTTTWICQYQYFLTTIITDRLVCASSITYPLFNY